MKHWMRHVIISALLVLSGTDRVGAAPYSESGGLVVMEMENTVSPLGEWVRIESSDANYVSGATGNAHLEFTGNTINGGPPTSPLEYTFKINQGGTYSLELRARKRLEGEPQDKCNDAYVKMEGAFSSGSTRYSTSTLIQDTKIYGGEDAHWAWATHLDGNGAKHAPAVYAFDAGETYTLTLSGRSIRFNLDRIVLRHHSVSAAIARQTSQPESRILSQATYTYDATEDFPSYLSGDVPHYIDKGNDALAIAANVASNRTGFARASRTFDGTTGSYDVTITTLTEEDGESTYRLLVNGLVVGTFDNTYIGPGSPRDLQPETHTWIGIPIRNGDMIAIESNADTNGEIPEGGGTAWARGRWRQMELAESLVRPPAGRLAIIADGNSPDPDDIGATAVMFGILAGSQLQDRLVHLSHSCDLVPVDRIPVAEERSRQTVLHRLCADGIRYYGPYDNLSDFYNCRSNQTEAVSDLTAAINASSAADPLWIIEAGEPDIIGFALSNAIPARIQHVHVVSHHPANDDSGDFFTWAQILAFGVREHQIGDQNVNLQAPIPPWNWAQNHPNPGIAWIWEQFKYAEQDPVVRFQHNKFDCSDAGMIYWWITGANRGGNSNATPVEIKDMLLYEGAVGTPRVTLVAQDAPALWTAGSSWSDGQPAHSGADYIVPAGGSLRGQDRTSTFPGRSLTIEAGGTFQVRAREELGERTTVGDLILRGGTSFAPGEYVQLVAGTGEQVTNILGGTITHSGCTRFDSYHAFGGGDLHRSLKVESLVKGTGRIRAWEASRGFGGENVVIDHAGNTFDGTWEVGAGTTLVFSHAGAVGTADIEVLDGGTLSILGAWDTGARLTVADAAATKVDLGAHLWEVSGLVVGGAAVADGVYAASELNARAAHPVFSGRGTIRVGDAPPPTHTGLQVAWERWGAGSTSVATIQSNGITGMANSDAFRSSKWGASTDGTFGTLPAPSASSDRTNPDEGLRKTGATDVSIDFEIENGSGADLRLATFYFDAMLKGGGGSAGPDRWRVQVVSGSITTGDVAVGALKYQPSGPDLADYAVDLSGLADHTLNAGSAVVIRLSFTGGDAGNSGFMDVDNVALTGAFAPAPRSPRR